MKRKNLLSLTIMAIAMALTMGLTSCGPKCEKENTGTVTVTNELGLTVTVKLQTEDGTTPSQDIADGSTGTFSNVAVGDITILETDVNTNGWDSFGGANCIQCETTEWKLYWDISKKSTNTAPEKILGKR